MSIRTYKKDHLKEHAGVTLYSAPNHDAPKSSDILVFWTHHDREPCEVNLHIFANGYDGTRVPQKGGRTGHPFTGRPDLIRQLAPAIAETLAYAAKATVDGYLNAIRDWWRLADAVETEAKESGHPIKNVSDVREFTNLHAEHAHRIGMSRQIFGKFRLLVDTTRMALGDRQTYWISPEKTDSQKHIPRIEQRKEVRLAIKRACRRVLAQWELHENLVALEYEPDDPRDAEIYRHVKYMQKIQKKTGKLLPTKEELCDGFHVSTLVKWGILIRTLREVVFPSHRDANAVWHLCLLNTGWNPSTLTTLDVSKKILVDHFKDSSSDYYSRFVLSPETYELVGEKERASGKEQIVIGLWKTQDGPGHLIKTYLKRVAPLRELLKQEHARELQRYQRMADEDAAYAQRTAQYEKIKELERGIRSVWLYVNRSGGISWIVNDLQKCCTVNGQLVYFMDEIVHSLNSQKAEESAKRIRNNEASTTPFEPVPYVSPSEFRVWFADFHYGVSNGNILHVKRALGHSFLRTTTGYLNNTIRNQEASNSARKFLEILVGQLEAGRVDLTILAHLYRYGSVTDDQEELLSQARALPISRVKVACKDTYRPPAHMKATPGTACDVQRCLLCVDNAVLLPESLDGIAMRVEELLTIQGVLPIEVWVDEQYDLELKNNLIAMSKFDHKEGLSARDKWAQSIANGEHYVPGLPFVS